MRAIFLKHIPKERRQFQTWQHVEAELEKAAAGVETKQVSIALQMVLSLEHVEYQIKKARALDEISTTQNVEVSATRHNAKSSGDMTTTAAGNRNGRPPHATPAAHEPSWLTPSPASRAHGSRGGRSHGTLPEGDLMWQWLRTGSSRQLEAKTVAKTCENVGRYGFSLWRGLLPRDLANKLAMRAQQFYSRAEIDSVDDPLLASRDYNTAFIEAIGTAADSRAALRAAIATQLLS